jgi:hypothetical protein
VRSQNWNDATTTIAKALQSLFQSAYAEKIQGEMLLRKVIGFESFVKKE